ncbi:MAG: primosomal protein N' [Pseudomonadota bacterium]
MTSELDLAGGELAERNRVPVLLPVALDQTYDYALPDHIALEPGTFVFVPFGPQVRIGVVWDRQTNPNDNVDARKLKPVVGPVEVPPLPEISLRFIEWIARYTLSPLGMVLRLMMGAQAAFDPPKPRTGVAIVDGAPEPPRMTPARQRAIDIAGDGLVRTKSALAQAAGCTTGVIDGLVKAGMLIDVLIPDRGFPQPRPDAATVTFEGDQALAVHELETVIAADQFATTLLDGVTGSGKTEVYFEAVAQTLRQDRQVLIMLPEIALTSQFLSRFEHRFGVAPVEWHSALPAAERGRIWRGVANGDVRCVVGARSGLFLPFPALGLIIVDEEHDTGFKQEDRVHYQARDMAVVRGHLGNIPVVLASATPSIESHVNALQGRYRQVRLQSRFAGAAMPDVRAIDMRISAPDRGTWLAPDLVNAMTETLASGQQSLLFLNRRGYAPLTLCRSCGHRLECPQCTAWLVEHRFQKRLNCHHCGFSLPVPERCSKCSEPDTLVACGPGVERVAEEVRERFPDASLEILSSDLVPGLTDMRKVIGRIESGEAQIVIGTQIVAKGHNFPNLALVGIVDGDLGLAQGADPRAGERTFQLLHQVTGRAGRTGGIQGRGLVQTYNPEHPVMNAILNGDRDAFLAHEIHQRQMGELPPFGRLAALIVSCKDKDLAVDYARAVTRSAPPSERIMILGPAEAPIAVVRGRFRFRILAKAPRDLDIQSYLRAWMADAPPAKGDLRITIDVDPYSFL